MTGFSRNQAPLSKNCVFSSQRAHGDLEPGSLIEAGGGIQEEHPGRKKGASKREED